MKILKTLLLVTSLAGAASTSLADGISGTVSLKGDYTVDGSNFNPKTVLNPNGATEFVSFNNVTVSGAYGDYSGTEGASVTHSGFKFDPLFNISIPPLWKYTVGTTEYSFDLTTMAIDFRNTTTIALSGTGYANITGLDETWGTWTFSAQLDPNRPKGSTFTFSSTDAVPDGGATAILLGVGLLGLGALRRKA
jgi:hypothetical protein